MGAEGQAMPIGKYLINVGEPLKPRYTHTLGPHGPHMPAWLIDNTVIDKARTILKGLAQDLNTFNVAKRECELNRDYDTAKYYRGLIQDWTKQHRAWKLVLGYFVDEPTLPYVPMQTWPLELVDDLDRAINRIDLLRF